MAPPNLWGANQVFEVAYNQTDGTYRLIGFDNKTGEGSDDWGTTAQPGTLWSYGQAVSRTTYAGLFARYGTAYGVGDGSTTFNLPDKRGRASFGGDAMGGVAAGRLTGAGGLAGTLGATGGGETHIHGVSGSTSGSLSLSLSLSVSGTTDGGPGGGNPGSIASGNLSPAGHTHSFSASATGSLSVSGNTAIGSTIPPGIVCNYVIRI